ncbi:MULTISPECIES: class I SAM-dependent methyltransferase [Amycolatopsis]|uniref:Class I SAM-dependent methyltransferase n=1 Tax=Amycolatopsis tucumanensis TaxID=401106 RepID=A0ABP7IW29_9PSEU|nr:class I SAM-dependent methyltransferase [Amycolatopsis tucumanensis]MCF6428248.1 class I SAM-dependent methyltransferase [Amycolatopsis tucumanensis]
MSETTSSADRELWSRRSRSFGGHADAYDEHRPDYPLDGIRWALPPGAAEVVDLAAGTGKLTGGLRALGLRVTAVEPDPGMRAEFARRHACVEVLDGTAERIPLPDASADAVLAGQAFHWFDLDAALPEIARVLRPGGMVAGLWNGNDDSVPWVAEFARASGFVQRGRSVATLPEHPAFGAFEEKTFRHSHRRTPESLVETISTHSHLLVADDAERAETRRRVLEFLRANPATANGEFDLPLLTTVLRAVRR